MSDENGTYDGSTNRDTWMLINIADSDLDIYRGLEVAVYSLLEPRSVAPADAAIIAMQLGLADAFAH